MRRLAFPHVSGAVTDARLNAARGEIIAALEFAKMTAIARGSACRVTVGQAYEGESYASCGGTRLRVADLMDQSATEIPEGDVENEDYQTVDYPTERCTPYSLNFGDYDVSRTSSSCQQTRKYGSSRVRCIRRPLEGRNNHLGPRAATTECGPGSCTGRAN